LAIGYVTPQDFGVVTGSDDTAIIDAAFAAAYAQNKRVYFPGQKKAYAYNGNGQDYLNMSVFGDGDTKSIILLGDGKFLIDANRVLGTFRMEGLQVLGGSGAFRNRWTGADVSREKIIRGCYFQGQTGAVISTNTQDGPFWKINDNHFRVNSETGVCIALSGLSDGVEISGNAFDDYKIAIKVGNGGNNARIRDNSFMHFGAGSGRVNIWVVPNASYINSGTGLKISGNRHGNENLNATDLAIVFADEVIAGYFGDNMPELSTESVGFVSGFSISEEAIYGVSASPTRPLVMSMTKKLYGGRIIETHISGTSPTHLLKFYDPPSVALSTQHTSLGVVAFSVPTSMGSFVRTNATE
jgi:hypothetical protein